MIYEVYVKSFGLTGFTGVTDFAFVAGFAAPAGRRNKNSLRRRSDSAETPLPPPPPPRSIDLLPGRRNTAVEIGRMMMASSRDIARGVS